MAATVGKIIERAQAIVGEVAGIGVQTYSEDKMIADCVAAFDLLFKKYAWPNYREWRTLTLNGATGIISSNGLSDVRDFEDIIAVHISGKKVPLPVLPKGMNPNTLASGSTPMFWTSLATSHTNYLARKVLVYPITSVGDLDFHVKVYPREIDSDGNIEPWTVDDTMHLDKEMLACGTAFMTLASDDINSQMAQTAKGLMETHYNNVLSLLADQPVVASSRGDIPMDWR